MNCPSASQAILKNESLSISNNISTLPSYGFSSAMRKFFEEALESTEEPPLPIPERRKIANQCFVEGRIEDPEPEQLCRCGGGVGHRQVTYFSEVILQGRKHGAPDQVLHEQVWRVVDASCFAAAGGGLREELTGRNDDVYGFLRWLVPERFLFSGRI